MREHFADIINVYSRLRLPRKNAKNVISDRSESNTPSTLNDIYECTFEHGGWKGGGNSYTFKRIIIIVLCTTEEWENKVARYRKMKKSIYGHKQFQTNKIGLIRPLRRPNGNPVGEID